MTLMLRMDGIPTRVGAGFAPVLLDSTKSAGTAHGREEVAFEANAHAWVEVFFSGIGWVPFDPTPGTAVPASAARVAASKQQPHETLSPSDARALLATFSASAARGHGSHGSGPFGRRHAAGGGVLGLSVWQWALLALVLGAGLGAWLRARAVRARRHAAGQRGQETALHELERALHGTSYPLRPGTTLTQIAQRLEQAAQPQAAAYVKRLRDLRFARARRLTAPEVSAARDERLALRRALSRGGGLRGRLRARRLLPRRAPSL